MAPTTAWRWTATPTGCSWSTATAGCFNGDELLYAMVMDRIAQGQRVPGAVGTLMTNMAVELALAERGVPLVRAKVGDRYVLEELAARGWLLGGEGSGHLLALDKHTTGDGIVSALQVLQAIQRSPGVAWPRTSPAPAPRSRRPMYAKWADAYNKATGARINYQSVGSGAGIKQIKAKTVDFGASDMPLKDDELAKDGLVQFPTVIGGVVPVVNIKGISRARSS
jgi:phosphomannomutase